MVKCKTDCVERPLSLGFGKLGHFIGRNPWVFLILPLVVSAGLGAGFYFLEERESNSIEGEFTPKNGPAKTERAYIQENFPEGDEFFSLRMSTDGASASVILLNYSNILTNESFQEISYLDRYIREIKADESTLTYEDICARRYGECVFNHILDYVNVSLSSGRPITYPFHKGEFVATAIGGVSLNTGKIETAIAIRLFYYLREDIKNETDLWLKKFIKTLPQHKTLETVTVSYFTSISREEEFDSNSKTVIPLFSITYFLAITVSIISCLRLDCVRNKVWVATFGVLAAGLAVLTSFGLLLLCGMPFVMTVATAPFLILGIGVDDMFIMISCWQRTKVHDSVEDRMAETYKEAAVSITITTLTDVLAFYIGLLTPFGSVQSFCMYTGTAILFCYIYNITFFGAFLALNGRREQSNRHWLTCMKVETPEESRRSNPCCVGGAFDAETKAEEEMPINVFFKKYYGPVLTNPWTKLFVIVLYAGYLSGSIYGCFQIQEGIDLKNLAPDDSYVASYYDNEKYYFREYGPFVMLIIRNEDFQYWNSTARQEILDKCLERFKSSEFVVQDVSWIKSYLVYGAINGINLTDENVFMSRLPTFLNGSEFKHDVKFSNDKIVASRIFLSTANISTAVDEKKMLKFFRSTATECGKDLNMLVYHPAFIYYDQYAVIVSNTVQNVLFATAVMLVISLLLIPNPLCSLWVTFAIASVIVGVAGFMALWDVNLDSISMINLVICIGFSVDFSAHISYAFVSSEKKSANEKAIDAIYNLGYPITQGAISTIAGVVVLAAAKSYIFRTFFKIMFLVIIFGALHGVVFIPIFLTFFGCCSSGTIEDENKENVRTSESCNSQRLSIPGKHPMNGAYTHKHGHANLAMDPSSP